MLGLDNNLIFKAQISIIRKMLMALIKNKTKQTKQTGKCLKRSNIAKRNNTGTSKTMCI
jgi:hypothetical protein